MNEARPPYREAALAAVVVLLGYLVTLAPSVTFWDAGEFIAAAKSLGIPHPPGTPLFVLIAHVWGMLVPFGEYAWRLNLLSALCGAVAAGCWFLVAHATTTRMYAEIQESPRRVIALGAGLAAALLTAFTFTNWQNAVETEVYSIAMLSIGVAAWLSVRWRSLRTTVRGSRLLLVMLFLGAISIGNHLLALLVGPALVAGLVAESARHPLATPEASTAEWVRIGVVATVWSLLIAVGLGNLSLTLFTIGLVLIAAVFALRTRQMSFVVVALLIAIVGISPYLFLLIRARQGPWLNEADPSTWQALLGVIRREQYAVRTPLDDPTIMHGLGNPGRTLTIFGYQLANYVQYFDWQWAKSIGITTLPSVGRLLVTLGAFSIGLRGAMAQRRRDRPGFWLMFVLWLVTGIGLVVYMNFKPGATVGYDLWPDGRNHEVRERDYFFVASFVAWGVWAAIGLADLVRTTMPRVRGVARGAVLAIFALAVVPIVLNFRAATRRSGPEATFARDFALALLQSVPPGGILFTWGDNDTFPLWYAQAVEGIRPDVTVVCLALSETQWYMRELRDAPRGQVDEAVLPALWRDAARPDMSQPLHTLTDASILGFQPQRIPDALTVPLANGITAVLPRGTAVFGKDFLVLAILRQNAGRRPIAWSVTAANQLFGLDGHLVQQGLVVVLPLRAPDPSRLAGGVAAGPGGAPIDLVTTSRLMKESWHFGELLTAPLDKLDGNIQAMASTIALPYAQLGVGLASRGDTAGAIPPLEVAAHLAPQPGVQAALNALRPPRLPFPGPR